MWLLIGLVCWVFQEMLRDTKWDNFYTANKFSRDCYISHVLFMFLRLLYVLSRLNRT